MFMGNYPCDIEKKISTSKCQLFLFNNTEWKHRLDDNKGAFPSIITNHISEIMSSFTAHNHSDKIMTVKEMKTKQH